MAERTLNQVSEGVLARCSVCGIVGIGKGRIWKAT